MPARGVDDFIDEATLRHILFRNNLFVLEHAPAIPSDLEPWPKAWRILRRQQWECGALC